MAALRLAILRGLRILSRGIIIYTSSSIISVPCEMASNRFACYGIDFSKCNLSRKFISASAIAISSATFNRKMVAFTLPSDIHPSHCRMSLFFSSSRYNGSSIAVRLCIGCTDSIVRRGFASILTLLSSTCGNNCAFSSCR